MIRQRPRRLRAGFTLVEMVTVLFLFSVFAGVAYEMCGTTLRMNSNVGDRLNTLATHDSALGQLRRDVWGATGIKLAGGSLQLTLPNQTITWAVDGDTLYESRGGADRSWPGCGDVKFELAGPVVIVHTDTAPNHQGETLCLTCEQQLLSGETR